MNRFIIFIATLLTIGCTCATAQEQMSWKDAKKAMKEARKWAQEHPDEAAQYMQQSNQQAAEALQRSQQAIQDAGVGMSDSQLLQGTLGSEYKATADAAKKAADARFKALPMEVRVPTGEGYTNNANKKHPVAKYNGKAFALAPQAFVAGTKAIVDWTKGLVPASKWVFRKREVTSAFYHAPKAVKWQGKQAIALTDSELEPDLGIAYLPENFSIEFDVWSCPSTSTSPQEYSDNFIDLCVWGDINAPLLKLHFTPNTPGPHNIIDGYEFSWSNIDVHSASIDKWEQADTDMKPKTWTHIAISCNSRDVSVYVNGKCLACYNRAYLYGMPRVFWLQSLHFRDKSAYIANLKVYEY